MPKVELCTYWLCGLGQVASISSALKWSDGNCSVYLSGLLLDSNMTISVQSDSKQSVNGSFINRYIVIND